MIDIYNLYIALFIGSFVYIIANFLNYQTKIHCKKFEEKYKEKECVICLQDINETSVLPCGHKFHTKCINSWLKIKQECPTCKYKIADI